VRRHSDPHPEFKEITAELLRENGIKAVVDGHNILKKDDILATGIVYEGIGR